MMKCRVPTCQENHIKHFCSLCNNRNSNHFSHECHSGVTLYHGTKVNNTSGIASKGLKPSTNGCLGPGIYFVEEYSEAESIAKHRTGNGGVSVVIECNVYLGKMVDLQNIIDKRSWKDRYDSAIDIHPAWAGISYDFYEICVKNPKYCSVKKVTCLQENYGSINTVDVGKYDPNWHLLKNVMSVQTFKTFTKMLVSSSSTLVRVIMGIKIALMIFTSLMQLGMTIVRCNHAEENEGLTAALMLLISFFLMLTISRVSYVVFMIRKAWKYHIYDLYYIPASLAFSLEFPLMVCDAYSVISAEKLDNRSTVLTIVFYFLFPVHLLVTLSLDNIVSTKSIGHRKVLSFLGRQVLFIMVAIMSTSATHMVLMNGAASFATDIENIKTLNTTNISSGSLILLRISSYVGAIGWGFWCILVPISGLVALVWMVANRKKSNAVEKLIEFIFPKGDVVIKLHGSHLVMVSVVVAIRIVLMLITSSFQIITTKVESKLNSRVWSSSLTSVIVFIALLILLRIAYVIYMICKVRYRKCFSLHIIPVVLSFFIEMPLLVSNAYLVKTLTETHRGMDAVSDNAINLAMVCHFTFPLHVFITLTLDNIVGTCLSSDSWLRVVLFSGQEFLIFIITSMNFAPVYLVLMNGGYRFETDVTKFVFANVKHMDVQLKELSYFMAIFGALGWGFLIATPLICLLSYLIIFCCKCCQI